MGDRGCVSHIVGGAFKGFIIGAIVGGLAGVALSRRPNDIARMAATSGTCFGAVKMVFGALIC